MKKCKHTLRVIIRVSDFGPFACVLEGPMDRVVAVRCIDCGRWTPLGPSNDTPEVAIEVRAAEIEEGDAMSYDESAGWWTRHIGRDHQHDETRPFLAGYLAHAIARHDEEQAAPDRYFVRDWSKAIGEMTIGGRTP